MVEQVVAGVRVQEYHQPLAVERQPRQYLAQHLWLERQLTAPVRVRTDRALVHATHFQWKQLRRLLTQGPRLIDGAGVEIDMGVVARYALHWKSSKSGRADHTAQAAIFS